MTEPRYRLVVFRRPKAPWRETREEVLQDAVRLKLACWDESKREHFIAVPCDVEIGRADHLQQSAQ